MMTCPESIAAAFFFLTENAGWFVILAVVATAGCIALGVVCVRLFRMAEPEDLFDTGKHNG